MRFASSSYLNRIIGTFTPRVKYLEGEGTKRGQKIAEYSTDWNQPINVDKTVIQIFHSEVTIPPMDTAVIVVVIADADDQSQ